MDIRAWLFKNIFPVARIYYFVSRIGYVVIAASGIIYTCKVILKPQDDIFTLGISAFGLIAVLSGLCFSFADRLHDENNDKYALYAAEKFLHSCILILLTIFINFIYFAILEISFVKNVAIISFIVNAFFYTMITILSVTITTLTLMGFEEIHDFIWERHVIRDNTKSRPSSDVE